MTDQVLQNEHHDHAACDHNHDHAHGHEHSHGHHDPAGKVIFGFWLFILSDCVLFAAQFATYSVLHNNTFGNIGIAGVASMPWVFSQTLLLLVSCMAYGLSLNSLHQGDVRKVQAWLLVMFLIGLLFVHQEFMQFHALYITGHSWHESAFLSAFFSLLGTHWVHLCVGLLWMLVLIVQFSLQKITPTMKTRLICLGLFWNFLNLIWVCIFTLVYLMGAI